MFENAAGRCDRLRQPLLDATTRPSASHRSRGRGPFPMRSPGARRGLAPAFTGTAVGDELGSLARALVAGGARLHWRYLPGPPGPSSAAPPPFTVRRPHPRRGARPSGARLVDPGRRARRSRRLAPERVRTCSTVIAGAAARSGTLGPSMPRRLRASSSTTCSAPLTLVATRHDQAVRDGVGKLPDGRAPRGARLDRAGRPLPRKPRADGLPRSRRPRARDHVRDRPARARRGAGRSAARRWSRSSPSWVGSSRSRSARVRRLRGLHVRADGAAPLARHERPATPLCRRPSAAGDARR